MRLSVPLRLFLTCWVVFALHFATNVVREHYPALTLAEHGSLAVDEYAGLHSDIFRHTDGHWYVNNQVGASAVAAVPLVLARPLLRALEERGKRQAAEPGALAGGYDTEYPMRRAFFEEVRKRGLTLKFGATAALTAVLLMAPLSALLAVLAFHVLVARGVGGGRALWLALSLAFATPVLYRAASLNHNTLLAVAAFGSFVALWGPRAGAAPPGGGRLFAGGFLAAACVAFDYSGVIPAACLAAYALARVRRGASPRRTAAAAVPFLCGAALPAAFLAFTQWSMFGDPFLPAQHWMPDQNEFVLRGARGFSAPDAALFLHNLVDLDWGLYAFAPLLALGLLPAPRDGELVLPRPERRFVAAYVAVFLLFCSCNQFGWLTWNTGFRYLMPLVPFVFLQASDHLARLRPGALAALTGPAVLHSWVLAMLRYTPPDRGDVQAVPGSWERFLREGVQFPWLRVLRTTPVLPADLLRAPWLPYALVAAAAVLLWFLWRGAGAAVRAYRLPEPASDR